MAKTLYLCYFGLREPLVQTQVLPYVREIMRGALAIEVSILTFEPESLTAEASAEIKDKLAAEGIEWSWLRYHKRFSVFATAYDVLRGTIFVWNKLRKDRIDVLHGRIHIPTLMGAVARKFSRQKPKLLFDIRGFFPEEYTDAGRWPENGWLFRVAKRVEKWLLAESDGFVVLTEKAREILFPESNDCGRDEYGRPVAVIPCCVDFERFNSKGEQGRIAMRDRLGISDRKVAAYVGSFGGWYMTDEMVDFFVFSRKADSSTFALILTQREPEKMVEILRARGLAEDDFLVKSIGPNEVADYLETADVAISFIKACYSKLSSSPTKIAEYLGCGVPIITNRGVGDVAEVIERNHVGVVIEEFNGETYADALRTVLSMRDVREQCRKTAKNEFDLHDIAGERYRLLYTRLLAENEP